MYVTEWEEDGMDKPTIANNLKKKMTNKIKRNQEKKKEKN